MTPSTRRATTVTFALVVAGCTGSGAADVAPTTEPGGGTGATVPLPPATELPDAPPAGGEPTVGGAPAVLAVADADGDVGLVDVGREGWVQVRRNWETAMSLDGRYSVATKQLLSGDPKAPTRETIAAWDSLPDGRTLGEISLGEPDLAPTATQVGGHLVAFTDLVEPDDGVIAAPRAQSRIVLADPDGVRWQAELDGNFEPEAFGGRRGADGLPAQLFLLEYFPAAAPRFYRVRVLSLETGEVSLPLNLRDKTQQVDERMAGISRRQVLSGEHGLLFTLYRGTMDGTPDGEPYAFIHVLDLADGVWCLDVPPELELERLPGSLAVGGDRLYVASANGSVGSMSIPSISDVRSPPEFDWIVEVSRSAEVAPALAADADGVWVGPDDGASRLVRLNASGARGEPLALPRSGPTAVTVTGSGVLVAGPGWTTFAGIPDLDWLDTIARISAP